MLAQAQRTATLPSPNAIVRSPPTTAQQRDPPDHPQPQQSRRGACCPLGWGRWGGLDIGLEVDAEWGGNSGLADPPVSCAPSPSSFSLQSVSLLWPLSFLTSLAAGGPPGSNSRRGPPPVVTRGPSPLTGGPPAPGGGPAPQPTSSSVGRFPPEPSSLQ